MATVRSVPADVSIPAAAAGTVTFTVPDGALGPVSITMTASARSIRFRLREWNGNALAPLPTFIEGTQQVMLFEAGEKVVGAHGYEAFNDSGGAEDAVLDYRTEV